jgi:hypothetical protein
LFVLVFSQQQQEKDNAMIIMQVQYHTGNEKNYQRMMPLIGKCHMETNGVWAVPHHHLLHILSSLCMGADCCYKGHSKSRDRMDHFDVGGS